MTSWTPEDGHYTRWNLPMSILCAVFYAGYIIAGLTTLIWGWPW